MRDMKIYYLSKHYTTDNTPVVNTDKTQVNIHTYNVEGFLDIIHVKKDDLKQFSPVKIDPIPVVGLVNDIKYMVTGCIRCWSLIS